MIYASGRSNQTLSTQQPPITTRIDKLPLTGAAHWAEQLYAYDTLRRVDIYPAYGMMRGQWTGNLLDQINEAIVAGVEFLSFQGLWLLVAGFILGFAVSTLWEWLYYRGKRQAQLGQTPSVTIAPARTEDPHTSHDATTNEEVTDAWTFSYRSPGVYLESEHQPTSDNPRTAPDAPQAKMIIDPPPIHATIPDRVERAAPRINPATLAVLENAVAQAPVAQPSAPLAPAPNTAVTGERHQPIAVTEPPDFMKTEHRNGIEHGERPRLNGVERPTVPPGRVFSAPAPVVEPAMVAAAVINPPPTAAVASEAIADHPDNLAMIRGVGEAYKRRLYGVGIYTWRQMAESDIETLRRITRAKPNADINAWRVQARELAEKYQRWQSTFRGPLDDFTRIDGIGAITADLLYKAGICTYEQLAGALPDELAKIVPAPTVGDENDFEGWIAAAVRFANVKRRNEGLLA